MKTKQIVIKPPLETSIAGLTFAVATLVGIGPLSAAGPLVYEPFNYGPGKLQLVSSWSKVTGDAGEDFVVQATNPHSPPFGPPQWLFQEPPAKSGFQAASQLYRRSGDCVASQPEQPG